MGLRLSLRSAALSCAIIAAFGACRQPPLCVEGCRTAFLEADIQVGFHEIPQQILEMAGVEFEAAILLCQFLIFAD